ncbi:hypothetical protein [Shewanella sp.]|uniref:hypothetical protein n=1 Tax=Shewanella sp. TaxID=50422 RepID=UPI004053FCB7
MDKLEQLITTSILSNKESSIFESGYEYKSLFISKVMPDNSNPRYFPAVIISDNHAYQVAIKQLTKKQLMAIYNAENKVVIGKSCIVNCCDTGSIEWKKSNETIASIISLGENIAVSEVIQAPTVYPTEQGTYQILTGHRRFFAMIYAQGVNGAAHFKVYHYKPALYKVKQFQENSSREDLPQYGKLQAFLDAMNEVEVLNTANKRLGNKELTVRETTNVLGISSGAFDNYNVLVRYPAVIKAYEQGNSTSFVRMKKLVRSTEEEFRETEGVSMLTAVHKREINRLLDECLNDKAKKTVKKEKEKLYAFEKIQSPDVLKMLLSENILTLEVGVNWEQLDWANQDDVNTALSQVLSYLSQLET